MPIYLIKLKSKKIWKILISLGLLTLVLSQVDLREVWEQFKSIPWYYIVLDLLGYTCLQCLSSFRWKIILRSNGYSVSMRFLVSSYFAGMFLNTFLPGSFGGDVYRVFRTSQKSKDTEAALVSVFLERFTGIAALLGLAFLGLIPAFSQIGHWDIILLLISCTVFLLGGVLLIVNQRILKFTEFWLNKLRLESLAIRLSKSQILLIKFIKQRKVLALSMLLSLIYQLLIVYYYYLVAQQLQIPVSYFELLVFIPIVTVVTLFPISLGGLGIREGLLAYLFNRVDLSVDQAFLFSLTVMVLGWLLSLPGGVVLLSNSMQLHIAKDKK